MAEMNYTKFKQTLSSNNLEGIYLMCGETYIIEHFEKILKEKILGSNYSDFDLKIINEENLNIEKLSVAIETFPVISPKKCIIIHNLPLDFWDAQQVDTFLDVLKDIPDFCHIIISQYFTVKGSKDMSKFKKINKFISKIGTSANFTKKDIPIEKQLIFWAKKDYNKNLSLQNAKIIKALCPEHDINAIKNELKKICEFESSDEIREKSISLVTSSKSKTNIFDLPKALFSKNAEKSFDILDCLLKQKDEPATILAILASEYIDIYRTKIFSNEKSNQLTQIYDYKGKEFRINYAEKRASKITLDSIKQSLEYLIEADEKIKSTKISTKLILCELITKLII